MKALPGMCTAGTAPGSEELTRPRAAGRARGTALLVLLLCAALAGASRAQADGGKGRPPGIPEPLPGESLCGWCSTTGRIEFDVDKKFKVEEEHGDTWKTVFCSEAIDSDNFGMDWLPCQRCKTPSLHDLAVKQYDSATGKLKDWLAARRKVDKAVQAESALVHVQTTHFVIAWDVPKITLSTKQLLRAHDAAHLYARRMEELYARFQALFGIVDTDNMRHEHFIYIFDNQRQGQLAGPLYTGLSPGAGTTVKRAGGVDHESAIVTWWDRSEFPKDGDMHRHQIHNVIHALTAIYYNPHWFQPGQKGLAPPWLNDKYGWLDEGLPHWFEIQFDGKATNYCFREQDVTARWGSDNWRKNVYKAVVAQDVPSFTEVVTKPSPSLSAREHQFVWSWVDYLMARDPAAMGTAIKLCKMKVETRDILKQAWNLNPLSFEQEWAAWVLENYSPNAKPDAVGAKPGR